jgi:hypothetical protein
VHVLPASGDGQGEQSDGDRTGGPRCPQSPFIPRLH